MHNRLKILLAAALLMTYPMLAEAMTNTEAESLAKSAFRGDTTSLNELGHAAAKGDATAQNWLGGYYSAEKSYVSSDKWFHKAAEQGNAPAEFNLGGAYSQGRGVPQNYVTADAWFRKAAEQGYPLAEFTLGNAYYQGQGVPQNYVTADAWFRKASEQGNAPAEFGLGLSYYKGHGVHKDNDKAIYWLRKSAMHGLLLAKEELNHIDAQNNNYLSLVNLFNVSPYSNKGKKYRIYFSKVVQSISEHDDLLDFQGSYYLASFKNNTPQKGDFISGYCSGLGATKYQSVTNKLEVVPHVLFYKFKTYNLNTPYGQEMSIALLKKQIFSGMSSMDNSNMTTMSSSGKKEVERLHNECSPPTCIPLSQR
jgi:FOG: TPR repeat, SEL1 subfamily